MLHVLPLYAQKIACRYSAKGGKLAPRDDHRIEGAGPFFEPGPQLCPTTTNEATDPSKGTGRSPCQCPGGKAGGTSATKSAVDASWSIVIVREYFQWCEKRNSCPLQCDGPAAASMRG